MPPLCPRYAVVLDAASEARCPACWPPPAATPKCCHGAEALAQVATLPEVDAVMAAIVGAAGLPPTLAAVRAGKRVLLANKESLVMAGELFMGEVRASGSVLPPIDSEHNAIFQSLPDDYRGDLAAAGVERIVLTASGGPFRGWRAEQLADVTPAMAVKHPNWGDGPQDFGGFRHPDEQGPGSDRGALVVQRRAGRHRSGGASAKRDSLDGALPRWLGGGTAGHAGHAHADCPCPWPGRSASTRASPRWISPPCPADLRSAGHAELSCLRLAFDALHAGGNAPAVLNAANEIAVAAFLDGALPFTGIPGLVDAALARFAGQPAPVSKRC